MDAAKRSQECAQRCACSFTTIAVNFAHAITIVIASPLVLSVIDGRVFLLDPVVTAVLVRVDDRRFNGNGFRQNAVTGGFVAVCNHPASLFARLTIDDMQNWRAIIVIGAVSRLLIRATTRWITRLRMGRTFFPPRSDRSHRPRTFALPSYQLEHSD